MRDNRMTSRAGLLGIAAASVLTLTACGTDEISADVLNEALDEAEGQYVDEALCDEPLAMEDGASVECDFVNHRGNDSDVALTYSEEHAIEWTGVVAGGGDMIVELDDNNEPVFEDEDEDESEPDQPEGEPAEEEPAELEDPEAEDDDLNL